MGRFESTRSIDVPGLEHSVVALPWGVLRGAFGPSDGTAGAGSNVPSAISVLRHATLYLKVPEEIDEAFGVLEQHAIRTASSIRSPSRSCRSCSTSSAAALPSPSARPI